MRRPSSTLAPFTSPFLVCATVALLASAALVIYLQHKTLTAQDRQTRFVLQAISEKAAASIESQIRLAFESPFLETVMALDPPVIVNERFDLIIKRFAKATREYPHIDRFFLWTLRTQAIAPNEVLFYAPPSEAGSLRLGSKKVRTGKSDPSGLESFYRDAPWGRYIYRIGQQATASQRVYITSERMVNNVPRDIFVRLYWPDAKRDRVLALMGFVINLDSVRSRLFPKLNVQHFDQFLNPAGGVGRFAMQILDHSGHLVFSTGQPIGSLTTRRSLDMRFAPANLLTPDDRRDDWTLLVGPAQGTVAAAPTLFEFREYLLGAVSVLLMLASLVFAVHGYRREQQIARAQADFVAHASHQLKTPLTLLNGVCETLILERAQSPERQTQYLELMRGGTARLTALVERILEFSRVDGGQRRYEMELVGLGLLVRETVDTFRGSYSDEPVEISFEEDPSPLIVRADPVAVEQAIVNLLDNAVKYSAGAKKVAVQVFRSASEAIVQVSDQGIGIAKSDHARVFEKFYRGAGASLNLHGFGLGLAIARELVHAHHGRIELESRKGNGSTFRIRLPLARGTKRRSAMMWLTGRDTPTLQGGRQE